jgi:nucleoside-diphosphate-sugar epimerase
MKIFVTGASGFVGSTVVQELLQAGYQVLGLTRSDKGVQSLRDLGAEVQRGSVDDPNVLEQAVSQCDGVIHTAFNHDFSQYVANCEADRKVIETLGSALAGSDRPLIVTSGTGMAITPGRACTEEDASAPSSRMPRAASEEAADSAASKGARVCVVRLPQVHDRFKQGLVSYAIAVAREKGVSAYVGDGSNRWPAVHRLDAAKVYRLALEKGLSGARYHAVDEEGVPVREIAEAIGRGLKIPMVSQSQEEAAAHFGWLGVFAAMDAPASSALTQTRLGWQPRGNPGLLADLSQAADFDN